MRESIRRYKYQLLFIGLPIAFFIGMLANTTPGELDSLNAYIAFSPDKITISSGDTFRVAVLVNSTIEFNAVEATIEFPKEILQIDSVSYEDSIINFWIEEPIFSNDTGTLKFSGIITSPGYIGQGNLLEINFKTKTAGIAMAQFSHASILANDGKGTEVLEKKIDATYMIKNAEAVSIDFNNDGMVNITDISAFIPKMSATKLDKRYDLNMDGAVNIKDLSILLSRVSNL